jgi:hypothetical protein
LEGPLTGRILPPVTDAEELALIDAALTTLLQGGQGVTILGRAVTRADYAALTKRRDALQVRIRRAARGGIPLQRAVSRE